MKIIMIIVIICLKAFITFSQVNDSITIKKIIDETMINGTAYENLRMLCKQVGPRLSGSPQYLKAVTLTVKMMKAAGADTVYLQQCMVPHWIRGDKETGQIILPSGKKYELKLCALGNSIGTGGKGITASVIEINSIKQLDSVGVKTIKGKIVFFNFPMNPAFIRTFNAYAESGVSRVYGPALAAKYGATGAIVRSLASNPDNFPHTGVTVYNDSFPKIPAVAISTNDADYISKLLRNGSKVLAYFRTTSKMLPDTPGYNVIGEKRGIQFPEEIITVGGHLDSWDLAEGAHDDGAGVVQSMEVLRAITSSGIPLKRTVRAVLFANEENGGRGAVKYLNVAKANNEQHIFAIESDAGGFTPRGFGLEMNDEKINKILQWKDLFHPYGVFEIGAGHSGSDVEPLKEIGTPLAGLNPDSQRYFDIHHAVTDVFENVSRRELHLAAGVMAALVYLVSEYGL
ncbi:MAG: M20/M25/M40 family metallo-hydrolase [Ginsengibacter sp.]